MAGVNWQSLQGKIVAGRYELQRLLAVTGSAAEFSTDNPGRAVRLTPAGQMLPEALLPSFDHPGLRRTFERGSERFAGIDADYAVVEAGEESLGDGLSVHPLSGDQVQTVAASVIPALLVLHDRGLVYMNLSPETVMRVSGVWKLGAVEMARSAAPGDPAVTRHLLGRAVYVPPEAFSGNVSPAWDVWSLGILLKRLLTPPAPRVRGKASAHLPPRPSLPEPYDEIVRECLRPDPSQRAALTDVARRLGIDPGGISVAAGSHNAAEPPRRVRSYEASMTSSPPRRRARAYDAAAPATLELESPRMAQPTEDTPPVPEAPGPAFPEPEPHHTGKPMLRRAGWAAAGVLIGALLYTVSNRADEGAAPGLSRNRTSDSSPVEQATPAPAKERAPLQEVDRTEDRRAAVNRMLQQWTSSTRNLDLDANVALYAPRVERFFGRRNVDRDFVRREKASLFRSIRQVREFEMRDVRVEFPSRDRAVVTFRKDWDFAGTGDFAGAEKARLTLAESDGGWRIIREEELTVFWTRRGSAARDRRHQ